MISTDPKFIFVHIPKTAGTSVEKVIWPAALRNEESLWMGFIQEGRHNLHNKYQTGGLQHLKAIQIRDILGRDAFESYYKFTIVRNPFTRSISQFKYIQTRPDLRSLIGLNKSDSFLTYLKKTYRRMHVQWDFQVSFTNGHFGETLVDDIIKFENLSEISRCFEKCGFTNAVLPHLNPLTYNERITICKEAAKIIVERYYDDFVAFDYGFTPPAELV